jgi:uncharacterized protein (DUF488 family)
VIAASSKRIRKAPAPPGRNVEPRRAETVAETNSRPVVLTVGHSTRPLGEFIALLTSHSAAWLLDVRTVARSRHNPQFNSDTLSVALEAAGIHYAHVTGLGGFRRAAPESLNQGWRNAAFRGYADYMQTPEFARNLASLMELAKQERVALMCAEAVPWRCHRSLIADALVIHGVRAAEIINTARCQIHSLTSFAKVNGTEITYPPSPATEPAK